MSTTNARILALGGEIQQAPVGRWATDYYLQRMVIATCGIATLAALFVSLIPTRPDSVPAIQTPRNSRPQVVDIRLYNSSPPSIKHTVSRVQVKSQENPMPKPVPDSELFEEPEIGPSNPGTAIGGRQGVHTVGDDEVLPDGNWAPSQSRLPEVFLFVEVPPELVSLTNPVYPELAREAGVEGTVHVKILVSEEGFVLEALVLEGLPLLNEVAVAAARTAIFRPAQQSGQPVRTWVVMPIEFSLRR